MRKVLTLVSATLCAFLLGGLVACGEVRGVELADVSAPNSTSRLAGTAVAAPVLSVSFIDVGKGDCILVQVGATAALIDTGYEDTAGDVLSYLRGRGVSHLDAVILTHYDKDHVGGVRSIGESVSIDAIYLPGYEGGDKNYCSCISAVKALGVQTRRVTKELTVDVGGAHLTVFPSGVTYELRASDDEGNDNDASLVVTLTEGRSSFLFAGDLEEEGIGAYLKANRGRFDVLKMPHHGRRSPNTLDLIEDVRPQIAVITDAKKDSADKKTLKLLNSADVEVWRTSIDGTIIVESDGAGDYSVSSSKS